MWTNCYYFLLLLPGIVLSKYYEPKTIFLEETFQSEFKCGEKPNGFYTFVEDDCVVYHVCKSKTIEAGRRLTSTHLCPPATRFDMKSKECKAWDEVICQTDFDKLPSQDESFKTVRKPRKKRAFYASAARQASYVNNQQINNIPHNCYWCCKPSTGRPENQVQDYFSTTTLRPTTTAFWWYPASTTTQRPTTQFWWGNTLKPATFQQPEIIEAKTKRLHRFSNGFSPASDVLLKFKRFHGKIDNEIKDDFVVIEDNYNPEVIEAVVVKK